MEKFRDICNKVKFQNIGNKREDQRRDPLGVWLGPLYIEPSMSLD